MVPEALRGDRVASLSLCPGGQALAAGRLALRGAVSAACGYARHGTGRQSAARFCAAGERVHMIPTFSRPTPPSRPPLLALLTVGVLSTVGCAGIGDQDDAVGTTALRFAQAVGGSQYDEACVLLALQTRRSVERRTKQPCPQALAGAELPSSVNVTRVSVAGRSAQAVLDGDVVFLDRYDDGWRVIAAGCVRDSGDDAVPYVCELAKG